MYERNLKELRNETLKIAQEKYVKNKIIIYRKEIGFISFTTSGLKEAINQPHPYYQEKLNLIKENLEILIKTGEYNGKKVNDKDKNLHIYYFHYINIIVGNLPTLIVISEDKWGKHTFYSITKQKID